MGSLFNLFAQSFHANQRFSIAFESHQGRSRADAVTQRADGHSLSLFTGHSSNQQGSEAQQKRGMTLGFLVDSSKNQHANRKLNFEMQMTGGYGGMTFSMSFGGRNESGAKHTNQRESDTNSQSQGQASTQQKQAAQQFSTTRNRSNAFSASTNKSAAMNFSASHKSDHHQGGKMSFSIGGAKGSGLSISASTDSSGIKANIGGMQLDSNHKFKSAMNVLKNGRSAMKALKGLSGKK